RHRSEALQRRLTWRTRWSDGYCRRMARRVPSLRAGRRARAREHAELVRELERLARTRPGGAPERPIEVASPAQVDPMADATPCPLCEAGLRLEEHRAETVRGVRLRVAAMRCTRCGVRRALYFRLASSPLH